MKIRFLILIGFSAVLVGGFLYLTYIQYTHYKTWANNEHYYEPVNGMEIVCDVNLWKNPSNCYPINEKGEIVEWPENIPHMGKQ
jgi:hypothetical protein